MPKMRPTYGSVVHSMAALGAPKWTLWATIWTLGALTWRLWGSHVQPLAATSKSADTVSAYMSVLVNIQSVLFIDTFQSFIIFRFQCAYRVNDDFSINIFPTNHIYYDNIKYVGHRLYKILEYIQH